MGKEIIVDVSEDEIRVAILESKKLVELFVERKSNQNIIGNIYIGKIVNILQGIQSAFVNIGLEKNAFISLPDLKEISKFKIGGKDKALDVTRLDNCGRCVKRDPSISDLSLDLVEDKVRITVKSDKGKKIMEGIKTEADKLKDSRAKFFKSLIQEAEKKREKDIGEYLKLSDDERFKKAMSTIEKCRLCGQCINACPVCYCQAHGRCEVQAKRKAKELTDPVLYWTLKMTHMSDICIGCGRCTPVCPVNIPNAFFYDVMNKFVEEEFKYVSGKSKDDLQPRSMKAIKAQEV